MALGTFRRLFQGLTRTREGMADTIRSLVGGAVVDEAALDDLEVGLLAADLGPTVVADVVDAARRRLRSGGGDALSVRDAVRATLRAAFPNGGTGRSETTVKPRVVFVVGVNGGGKTTTVGKLAALERARGRRVTVVAADTFRAAAIDQLERWVERAGCELVKQREGADPSAIVFDALRAARAHGVDTVLVDTAGRLHTKVNLMAELEKMSRVAGREVEGAPHDVLLVVDATTGQNGIAQAREFTRAVGVTGVVVTKLDGTAKGGVAVGIHRDLGVPIRFVGVGESLEDLLEFDADAFVDGLLGVEPSR